MDAILFEGPTFIFPVIIAHLRRQQEQLLVLQDFQSVISHIKKMELSTLDADAFMGSVYRECRYITPDKIIQMRSVHRECVNDEIQRIARIRDFQKQVAIVQQIPAFSSSAVIMLRYFQQEAERSSRSDVAFLLTLLCHGLVWLAERSRNWKA